MICPICKKKVLLFKKETDELGKVINYFSCGHKFFQVCVHDSGKSHELLGIKKRTERRFSKDHKFEYEVLIGERVGKDAKPVFIHQIIDRVKNYYKKFVKRKNIIIKNIETKLTEHK